MLESAQAYADTVYLPMKAELEAARDDLEMAQTDLAAAQADSNTDQETLDGLVADVGRLTESVSAKSLELQHAEIKINEDGSFIDIVRDIGSIVGRLD